MRCLLVVALLLTVAFVTGCGVSPLETVQPTETDISPTAIPVAPTSTSTPMETMPPAPPPSEEPTAEGPQLRMVLIRAKSPSEVQQLRQMHLDIVRITSEDSSQTPSKTPSGEFIVEAVVTRGQLAKLKGMGFEVSEIPPEK